MASTTSVGNDSIVNYMLAFPEAIAAQGKGLNVLILTQLQVPFKRFDRKLGEYELEHRWLSQECQEENDQAWACVQGSDLTFWLKKEFDLAAITTGSKTLFDLFRLF